MGIRHRRVRTGSGEPLRRYRWWQMFGRSLRSITLDLSDGTRLTYSVDVRHAGDMTDGEIRARLYVDGSLRSYAKLPTRFGVPDGHIEVAINGFGLKRCHYVRADGTEQQLTPDPASAEGRRARFHHRYPGTSRVIGAISTALVIVGLGVEVPQIIGSLSHPSRRRLHRNLHFTDTTPHPSQPVHRTCHRHRECGASAADAIELD